LGFDQLVLALVSWVFCHLVNRNGAVLLVCVDDLVPVVHLLAPVCYEANLAQTPVAVHAVETHVDFVASVALLVRLDLASLCWQQLKLKARVCGFAMLGAEVKVLLR
jgi:hypothetical protein